MTIEVKNDKVAINNFETDDPDLIIYFENLKQKNKNLEEELYNLLKLGVLAAKAGNVGLSTDFVKLAVSELQNNFQQEFDDTFGDTGTLPKLLADNLGEDGKLVTDLLNPEKKDSPLNKVKQYMDESFHQIRTDFGLEALRKQLMKTDPKKGKEFEKYCEELLKEIAKSHGDIVENKTKVTGNVANSQKGDYVYSVTELSKNIVLDMKDYTTDLHLRETLDMLDIAMQNRDAEFAILVSKRMSALPKETGMFQQYGNKLLVALTADDSEDALIAEEFLEIAVKWARLRLREKQGGGIDMPAIFEKMKNVDIQMNRFSGLKTKCSSINTQSDGIKATLGEIESEIKENLTAISDSLNATPTKKEPAS